MSEAQNPLWAVVGNRGFEPSDRPVPWLFNHMSDAQGKADHLNRFDNTNQYYAAPVFVVRKEWVKAVQDRADLARAQVAAAYERAAEAAYQWWDDDDAQELRHHIRSLTPDDAKAALDAMLKAEQAKAHKDGQMAAFKRVIGHLTGNKPDSIGNHRAIGYHNGWMDALAAVREMAREDGE